MKSFKKKFIATAIVSSLILPATAFATNGLVSEGNGAKARGTGGAGVAMANENASIVTNPAAVVGVGDRLDVAIGLFSPSPRKYELAGNNLGANGNFNDAQTSKNDLFVIPSFGMAFPIDSQSAWSIGLNAAGGMNTEYSRNFGENTAVVTNGPKTGIDLKQLYLSGTYGRKVGSNTTLGITALAAYQTFEATGLSAFGAFGASIDSTKLSNNGVDTSTGFGVKIGVQGVLTSSLKYGIAYQPKIKMSKFEKYKGLFANGGEMDIPATFSAGIAYDMNPKTTLVFDYLYIDYEGVAAIGNSLKNFTDKGKLFGQEGGPGFGWKSINVFKLGVAYAASADWTYRVGWNHGDNPIDSSEVSVAFLAPAVITDHLTLGFTNRIDVNSEYTVDFVHSFKNSVSGPFAAPFGNGTMTVEMEQNFLEVAYSKMF